MIILNTVFIIYSCCHILAIYHLEGFINIPHLQSKLQSVRRGRPQNQDRALCRQSIIKDPARVINDLVYCEINGHGVVSNVVKSDIGIKYTCLYDHGSFGSKLSHLTEEEVLKQIENYRRHLEKVHEGSPITMSKKRKPCRMSSIAI